MRLFPFFQSGEPGAVSKEYDTAHTVDRSGRCSMSLAPEVRDMVLLAPSRGSVVNCSLSLSHNMALPEPHAGQPHSATQSTGGGATVRATLHTLHSRAYL